MVARITFPASISETLNYNEHKVQKGVAMCIAENNFLLPITAMNFYHKLDWFNQRNKLNERATTKTMHVSLNFSPSENFLVDKLNSIAQDYMERIGFGDQPYLVYQHKDAGHPHLHIVATTIRGDGTRINTHNIGRNQSEMARKLVEEKHGLIKAGTTSNELALASRIQNRLEYGKSETKRSIANVLKQTINLYNYVSLAQFNAILSAFGVKADRGKEESFTHRKNGLLYRMIDKEGQAIGIPIKASSIAGKPTLAYLENRFTLNKTNRDVLKLQLKNSLDHCLMQRPTSLDKMTQFLSDQPIQTVLRQNAEGRIYGITFVDHKNRSVFNGSELGKEYSIAGLAKKLKTAKQKVIKLIHAEQKNAEKNAQQIEGLVNDLLQTEPGTQHIPSHLKKKKRKKQRGI